MASREGEETERAESLTDDDGVQLQTSQHEK